MPLVGRTDFQKIHPSPFGGVDEPKQMQDAYAESFPQSFAPRSLPCVGKERTPFSLKTFLLEDVELLSTPTLEHFWAIGPSIFEALFFTFH